MKKPRPYQIEAARAAWDLAYTDQVRALVQMATGLGKTLTARRVAEHARAQEERSTATPRPVLAIVHQTELVDQLVAEFQRAGWYTFVEQGDRRASPIQVGAAAAQRPTVLVASVPTLQRRRLMRWPAESFCLILVDEAHHAPAVTWISILEHFVAPVVGFTATAGRAGLEEVFKLAYAMPLARGIEEGWLVPIQGRSFFPDGWDGSMLRKPRRGGDISVTDLADMIRGHLAGPLDAVREVAGGRQTLCFLPGVQASKEAAAYLCTHGIRAAWVAGESEADERARVLQWFRDSEVQALCNAAVLVEGVDLPNASVLAAMSATCSPIQYGQRLGRVARTLPGVLAGMEEATAARRRRAIAASAKPWATVMDFFAHGAGFAVMELAVALGGERSENVRARAAEELGRRMGDPLAFLAQAELDEAATSADAAAREQYEAEQAARRGEEELARLAAAQRARVEVEYHDGGALPWSNAEAVGKVLARRKVATAGEPRPTPAQLADYRRLLKRDGYRPFDVANLERIAREQWSRASMTAELHYLACKHGERRGRRSAK